jgi:ABC-type glutathione transport system ATPase component
MCATIGESVGEPLQIHDGVRARARDERVVELLGLVGLGAHVMRRYPHEFSGGQRQRIAVARAIALNPRLLVCDEPVSSLDPEGRRDLLALIDELSADATVIVSTHVLADVERVCDRVGILDHGRLVTEGPLDELLRHYALPLYRIEPEPGQDAAIDAVSNALRRASRERPSGDDEPFADETPGGPPPGEPPAKDGPAAA